MVWFQQVITAQEDGVEKWKQVRALLYAPPKYPLGSGGGRSAEVRPLTAPGPVLAPGQEASAFAAYAGAKGG